VGRAPGLVRSQVLPDTFVCAEAYCQVLGDLLDTYLQHFEPLDAVTDAMAGIGAYTYGCLSYIHYIYMYIYLYTLYVCLFIIYILHTLHFTPYTLQSHPLSHIHTYTHTHIHT
jgi:hypothetical protein